MYYIELQFREYFACMREEEFFLGWAGCALFMMQYAMLITLHIPKWKNCFKQKKRTKYDRLHRMYIFALYLKFKLKKKIQ